MKGKYVSDLHLEFSRFPVKEDKEELGASKEDILFVAGDTVLSIALKEKRTDADARAMKKRFDEFLEGVSGFKNVYMIGGNHEAYAFGDYATVKEIVQAYIDKKGYTNIHFLENERVPLTDKVDLLACTLWTSMGNRNPSILMQVNGMMNDFFVANYKGRPFTTNDAADIHYESKRWLSTQLIDTSKNYIVMTHHLPSFQGIDPHFKGDVMNYGYASDMEDFIYSNPHITHWIHGHTHYNTDYMIDHTRVVSNQRGYPPSQYGSEQRGNWKGFKADKWIEL